MELAEASRRNLAGHNGITYMRRVKITVGVRGQGDGATDVDCRRPLYCRPGAAVPGTRMSLPMQGAHRSHRLPPAYGRYNREAKGSREFAHFRIKALSPRFCRSKVQPKASKQPFCIRTGGLSFAFTI